MKNKLKQYKNHLNVFYDTDSDVFVKYWSDAYPFEKWWTVYQEYQKYEPRTVQILETNFKKDYFVMEAIKGKVLEQEMILLDFNQKKKVLLETMDIFNNFFRFECNTLSQTEVFFHRDFRTENIIYTDTGEVKLVDPNSFGAVPLDRMNNMLFFGKYLDVLMSIKERLSFEELTPEQKYKLGKGYLY
jgi:serine/threonine protein kinase